MTGFAGGVGPLKLSSIRRAGRAAEIKELLLMLLCVSICFQNVDLIALGEAAIKPYHLFTLVLLVASLAVRRSAWSFPGKLLPMTVLLFLTTSLINIICFQLSAVTFNYVFFLLMIVSVYNLGYQLSEEAWIRLSQNAGCIVLIIIIFNMFFNSDAIIRFFSNPWGGHPAIPSIFGGGVNLDASWLALFGVFFDRNAKGGLFLLGSLLVSVLLASRVGLILSLLSVIYVYVVRPRNVSLFTRTLWMMLCVLVVGLLLMNYGGIVLDRFFSVGEEAGSQGRMNMWQFVPEAFAASPLIGYGAGNAVSGLEFVSGWTYSEGNIHNYFFQVLLDFGIIGFVPFVLLVAGLLLRAIKDGFQNRFAIYIICWLVGSFFQFRGADAMLGFFIGAFFATICTTSYIQSRSHS